MLHGSDLHRHVVHGAPVRHGVGVDGHTVHLFVLQRGDAGELASEYVVPDQPLELGIIRGDHCAALDGLQQRPKAIALEAETRRPPKTRLFVADGPRGAFYAGGLVACVHMRAASANVNGALGLEIQVYQLHCCHLFFDTVVFILGLCAVPVEQ